jgi:hypothetical protein
MNNKRKIFASLVIVALTASCGPNSSTPNQDTKPRTIAGTGSQTNSPVNFLVQPHEKRVDDHHLENYDCKGVKGFCIASLTWGQIKVQKEDGSEASFKDAIVWWSGAEEWNWKVDGTTHPKGITVQALDHLLKYSEITDLILTRGMEGVLTVPNETIEAAQKAGVRVHIAFTRDAVELFNKLIKEGKKVGGLMHSTC